jgi:biotin-dependent carboxylase-like uncharacterized protein
MSTARLQVSYAGPLTTVQDLGRFGYQRYGVTEGGPMDRTAFAIGQFAVGQTFGGASIEVGLGGIALRCVEGSVLLAITGGNFTLRIDGQPRHGWTIARLHTGMELGISQGRWGSWCYIATAGDIRWPMWLGSRSTFPASPFTGEPLKRGDEIVVENIRHLSQPERELPIPVFCQPRVAINVVIGPQERFFDEEALRRLLGGSYFLSSRSDRMGVWLDGPKLAVAARLDMPSEGVLRGSVQVPGGGDPLVLMADHQTTGGYPKIATIISADQDAFAQLRAHQPVRFQPMSVERAVERARTRKNIVQSYFEAIRPRIG